MHACVRAFVHACIHACVRVFVLLQPDDRGTPENALQDLAVIEAVVSSGLLTRADEVNVLSVV